MNAYFLVEGKCTEKEVYPAWLAHLVPHLEKVRQVYKVEQNQYFLFSGEGYPSLLKHLLNAIKDVNKHGKFDYFVLCLDTDDRTPESLKEEIEIYLKENNIRLNDNTTFIILFQKKCIETWFLGNRTFFKRNPQNAELCEYIQHYNVHDDDPELMPKPSNDNGSIANFHHDYFQSICEERNCRYTKKHPGIVTEKTFLDELIKRFKETGHIESFGKFIQTCRSW